MLVEPVTLGVKICVLPRRTDDVAGVRVTLTEEGVRVGAGDDGLTEVDTPPLQPRVHAAVTRRTRIAGAGKCDCAALQELLPAFCERGRMLGEMQAKGQDTELGAAREPSLQRQSQRRCKLLEVRGLG